MDVMWFVGGLLLGALLGAVVAGFAGASVERSRGAVALARAETERDALAERVRELGTAALEDRETASVLAPMRATLDRVEGQVRQLERERHEQLGLVTHQLGQVQRGTQDLSRQTVALVESLRSSQTRGVWGEVQLRRVLELSGMLAHCDFEEQVVVPGQEGQRQRPDAVVTLPGGKHLVLDAKAPAAAFLAAQAQDLDAEATRRHLDAHAKALRGHVSTLAGKEYWTALPRTADLVVCFVPSDAMLTAALAHDPSLHEDALAQRVVLAGPGGLLAVLRAVAYTWRQDALTNSAEELLRLGRELHARLGKLQQHTASLGKALENSVRSYNAFLGSLETRVLVTARKMEDLGVVGGERALPELTPLDALPRPATAPELTDPAAADRLDTPGCVPPTGRGAATPDTHDPTT